MPLWSEIAKTANRERELEQRLRTGETVGRRIHVRAGRPQRALRLIRIRWNFDASWADLSEAELVDASGTSLNRRVWVDGVSGLRDLQPKVFGDSVRYEFIAIGWATRGGTRRMLVRATRQASSPAAGARPTQLVYHSGANPTASLKNSAFADIQTTINFVAVTNNFPLLLPADVVSVNNWMWDCAQPLQWYQGDGATPLQLVPDIVQCRRRAYAKAQNSGGSFTFASISIDPGEDFQIDLVMSNAGGGGPKLAAMAVNVLSFSFRHTDTNNFNCEMIYLLTGLAVNLTGLTDTDIFFAGGFASTTTYLFTVVLNNAGAFVTNTLTITLTVDASGRIIQIAGTGGGGTEGAILRGGRPAWASGASGLL